MPTSRVQRFYADLADWKEHRGTRVSATTSDDASRARALTRVFDALDLLATYAPEQCERLSQYMHGIVIIELYGPLATWQAEVGMCLVDQEYALADSTETEQLASTIVHELMHARLDRAGIRYEGRNRARCERLCFLAERNFVAKLPESAQRARAEARVNRYLQTAPEFWSDAVMDERERKRRKRWPRWLRMVNWFATRWFRLRRAVLPNGR